MDYCDFCDDTEQAVSESHSPILVTRDRGTTALFAGVMTFKGVNDHAVNTVVNHIVWLGHHKIKLRADGGLAIQALGAEVSAKLKTKGIDVVPDLTPKGDSQAGGVHESAVRQFKERCRVIVAQAAELHGVGIHPPHPMLPWAVSFAAQLITRTVVNDDGTTA